MVAGNGRDRSPALPSAEDDGDVGFSAEDVGGEGCCFERRDGFWPNVVVAVRVLFCCWAKEPWALTIDELDSVGFGVATPICRSRCEKAASVW